MEDRLRTIAQEKAHIEMMRELENLEVDVRDLKLRGALIPAEWHEIERTVPVRPRRKKVTVALDADVAKWFQGMGEGYHRRINAVLRTFMLALISKEILSRGDTNRHGEEILGEGGAEEEGVRGAPALAGDTGRPLSADCVEKPRLPPGLIADFVIMRRAEGSGDDGTEAGGAGRVVLRVLARTARPRGSPAEVDRPVRRPC